MALFKNRGKIAVFTAAVLTAFSFTGCGVATTAAPAETYTIERQDLKNSVSVSGTVSGCDLVKITSTVTEPISKLNVGLGDYVKKGDVLCTFDSTALQERYDNLKKRLELSEEYDQKIHNSNVKALDEAKKSKQTLVNRAQKAINDAQSARDNAYNRYNDLCSQYSEKCSHRDNMWNSMQVAETEEKKTEYGNEYQKAAAEADAIESARDALYERLGDYDNAIQEARDAYNETVKSCDKAIEMAQDTLDSEKYKDENDSKKDLDKLKEQLDNCTITAPMDGIITSISVSEGTIPTTDAIMTIEDDSALKITATVREADILKLSNGMKAIVKTSATKDKEFDGEVTKVVNIFSAGESSGYFQQSEGGYKVEVTVKNSENVFIGMNAKVEIIIDKKDDVIAVPFDAITTDENDNTIVYIARENGNGTYKAEPAFVTKEMETDYFIEITSDDVREGDLIVTSPEYMESGAEFMVRTGGLTEDEE